MAFRPFIIKIYPLAMIVYLIKIFRAPSNIGIMGT